jgi:lipid-A-disaccharide synthase
MLNAAARLSPRPLLLVSSARPDSNGYIESQVRRTGLDAEILHRSPGEILSAADAALITSGSATMEAVYYACPTVVVYRLSRLSYFFAKPHIAGSIALPNLTAGRQIVPELVLASGRGEPVARAAQQLLDSEERQEAQRREFATIRERLLRERPASEIAADVVEQMLRSGVA